MLLHGLGGLAFFPTILVHMDRKWARKLFTGRQNLTYVCQGPWNITAWTVKEPAFNSSSISRLNLPTSIMNSKGIVLTHMQPCLESMQAFERFLTYKSILSLKWKRRSQERIDAQIKPVSSCFWFSSTSQHHGVKTTLTWLFSFKLRFLLSELIQTHLQTVGSKKKCLLLAKQSCFIVWGAKFSIAFENIWFMKCNQRAPFQYSKPKCNCIRIYTRVKHGAHSNAI